jgi:lambda family phage portal protein
MNLRNIFKIFSFKRTSKGLSTISHISARYDVGLKDDLLSSIPIHSRAADEEIRSDLVTIRARSRYVAQNSAVIQRYLSSLKVNVLGENGFTLQVRGRNPDGTLDTAANNLIEELWQDWQYYCDIEGKLNFFEMLNMIIESVARDGEIFIYIDDAYQGNKYHIALQLIEADYCDVNHWSTNAGNQIRCGIEYDSQNRIVAYWFKQQNGYKRIDASNIIHLFKRERVWQSRGYPWIAPVIIDAIHLQQYIKAAVVNARIGAAKMGFYKQKDISVDISAVASEKDIGGKLYDSVTPGQFGILPAGMELQVFDPKYPDQQFADFVKAIIRNIAIGLNVSYESLSGDLSQVNYSSARVGLLAERDYFKSVQRWFKEVFLYKIFERWLDNVFLLGLVRFENGIVPYQKKDKYMNYEFIGRGYDWVDPEKDIDAKIKEIMAGLSSWSEVAAMKGKNLEDIVAQIQKDKEIFAKKGIKVIMNKEVIQ